MRKFYTQLFLVVLMVTLSVTSGYSQANEPVANFWPPDDSETVLLPGSQTLTLTFDADDNTNTVKRLRQTGIISLNGADPGGGGTFQIETLQYGDTLPNGEQAIQLVGNNQVQVTFQHEFVEDAVYYVAISDDLIEFQNGDFYTGTDINYGDNDWTLATWGFKVKDITPPVMETCNVLDTIHNGQRGVSVEADTVYVCFSEDVFWAGGTVPQLEDGDVAFYHAINPELGLDTDPNGEYGGDVLYSVPKTMEIDGNVLKIAIAPEDQSLLKYAAIGDSIWPVDADIYMRFAGDLIIDKDTNYWAGVHGSPYDPYEPEEEKYWFTTRTAQPILVDIWNIEDNGFSTDAGNNPLWDNEDFTIKIDTTDLMWISSGISYIGSGDEKDLLEVEINGVAVDFDVRDSYEAGGNTYILIDPEEPYSSGDVITVRVKGGLVRSLALVEVAEYEEDFTAGDFDAPDFTVDLQNVLCTNFDIRVMSNETGKIYYALVESDSADAWGWDETNVSVEDILYGSNAVANDTNYFNNVEDGGAPSLPSQNHSIYNVDEFEVQPLLAAYEHIDDFTGPNHGDSYRLFYFALDEDAQGPYTEGLDTLSTALTGRASAVGVLDITLDDCLAPEFTWFSESADTEDDDVIWVSCEDEELDFNIKRQGRWQFKAYGFDETIELVNPAQEWMDVITMYADSGDGYYEVEIESAVYDAATNIVTVTPLYSYPSGGMAKIVLQSGAVQDEAGNVINYEVICERNVETYEDPRIEKFTVETKESGCADDQPELNGVMALRQGEITLVFNNPMFVPEDDELEEDILRPFSSNPTDDNWIGNYIKIREGDSDSAYITSSIWAEVPQFVFTPDANGGVESVTIIPPVDYASETWYYVEVDSLLLDENRVELSEAHNNNFVSPHNSSTDNSSNYFIVFKTEDTVNPELVWLFPLVENNNRETATTYSHTPVDDDVFDVNADGQYDGSAYNEVPVAARITEWSQMGFDAMEGYDPDDANSLREYFTMTNQDGDELLFDMVVLDTASVADGDSVIFGFIPFEPLGDGEMFHMEFDPQYSAEWTDYEGNPYAEGPVFIDCNGNPVLEDMNVTFTTWIDNMPTCIDLSAEIVGDTTPDIVLTFENLLPSSNMDTTALNMVGTYWAQIANADTTYQVKEATASNDFIFSGNTVTIPWEMFETEVDGNSGPGWALPANSTFTLTIPADAFLDRNSYNDTLRSCELTVDFNTMDVDPPVIVYHSPDEVNPGATGDTPAASPGVIANVRLTDSLVVRFSEPVTPITGKFIELWENGTVRKDTFYAENAIVGLNDRELKWYIPHDFLRFGDRYHVDVQEGLVEDVTGLGNPRMTGSAADDPTTWTFTTSTTDNTLSVVSTLPSGDYDPYSQVDFAGDPFELNEAEDSVKIHNLKITLSERADAIPGRDVQIEVGDISYTDLLVVDVDDFVTNDGGLTWTYEIPGGLWVPYNEDIQFYIDPNSFVANYGNADEAPDGNWDDDFWFIDNVAPTVKLWPENGDDHVAFNSHLYARFSEPVMGYNSSPTLPYTENLVITSANLQSWVKVQKWNGSSWDVLGADNYVVEFINPERTHIRITPLDEDAPGFNGVTASMEDEMQYRLQINRVGNSGEGNGYALVDQSGNALPSWNPSNSSSNIAAFSDFTTEDITPPVLGIACEPYTSTPDGFDVTFGLNEPGVVYWAVVSEPLTDDYATIANKLFAGTYANSGTVTFTVAGSQTVTLEDLDVTNTELLAGADYTYYVYAVAADDEVDIYVADNDFGDAWVTLDDVFVDSGDTNPESPYYAVGIRDIRPAPNKTSVPVECENDICDDDVPVVVERDYEFGKQWHTSEVVPTDASFTIEFNEDICSNVSLQDDNMFADPEDWAREIRLRKWENNVSVDITVVVNADSSVTITPNTALLPETRYYIEIDRFALHDCAVCGSETGQGDGFVSDDSNFFPGWVGKADWWFATNDEVPPMLVDVTPTGNCVDNMNNEISFTFKEGNVNGVMTNPALTGSRANIYIYNPSDENYADGEPYEVIYAHDGSEPVEAVQTGDSTWVITYETNHLYASEDCYVVQWDSTLFIDGSPNANVYVDGSPDVLGATIPDNTWDYYKFCTRDNKEPVIHWALVNTVWTDIDASYVYPVYNAQSVMATGSFDPNDPDYTPGSQVVDVNVCGDEMVPHKLAVYVWTDEDVTQTGTNYNPEDPFQLRVAGTSQVITLEADSTGQGTKTLPGGFTVKNDWWVLSPADGDTLQNLASLEGNTAFEFRIVGGELEDFNELQDCDANENTGDVLFNFCTWTTEPADATLADGCGDIIPDVDSVQANNGIEKDTCVCEAGDTNEYFELCFDKMVVKTAVDGAQPPITVPGAPWYTYANLLMNENDLKDTDNGTYIDFRRVYGEYSEPVVIDSVKIFVNGVEQGNPLNPCNCGGKPLCYRLYINGGLAENADYIFTVQDSVLKDQVRMDIGSPNGTLFPGKTWEFQTKWFTAPYITAFTPADDATNVSTDAELEIVFNREVTAGPGFINVRDKLNPDGFAVNVRGTDGIVKVDGNVVTIDPIGWFDDNTDYYVEIDTNFVFGADCDQLGFEGKFEQGLIEDDEFDEWNFRTGDATDPLASLWPNQNPDDYTAECVAPSSNLILTFDENVVFDTDCGELVIYKARVVDADNNNRPDGGPTGVPVGGSVYGDVVERIPFTEDNFPRITISGSDPANGLTDNVITVIPTNEFESGETYYVRIEGNGRDCDTEVNILTDELGNEWNYPANSPLPAIHYNDWWFTIDDDTAPELLAVTPERTDTIPAGQDGTGVTTDLVMEFDMDVWAGNDTIRIVEFIRNPEGGISARQTIEWKKYAVDEAVASGDIEIDGSTVTIKDVWLLDGIHWYYVLADPGALTNTVPCILKDWAGISDPDEWRFTTEADDTCPALVDELVDSDAMDEMYEDPATVNFTLTFSENISLLNGSAVAHILDSEGAVVAEASITPAHITDNMLSLHIDDFDASLMDTSMYTLHIPAEAIHDFATSSVYGLYDPFGNVPVGDENYLCEDVMIDFHTGDFTPPEVVNFMPTENCLENEVTIWAEFSEPVQDGEGALILKDADGILEDIVLDAAGQIDGNTVSFTVNLPDSTNWYVVVEEGFVTDMVYMSSEDGPYANVALDDPATWTFGIDDNTEPVLLSWETPEQDINNLETTFEIVLTYDDVITAVDETLAQLTDVGNEVSATLTAELGPEDNQVTVTVVDEVADQTAYMLELGEGFAWDDACGDANGSLDDEAGLFTVGDRTAPILEAYNPDGWLGSYIGVEVFADFFDDSDITVEIPFVILDSSGDTVTTWSPDLSNADQSASLLPALWFDTYEVVIPDSSVVDANGNAIAETGWTFSIIDNTPPNCLTIISPEDGDNCVGSDIVLEMEFCERMAAGPDSLLVRVFDMLEVQGQLQMNELFYTTAVVDSMINGEFVSIPVTGLEDNTSYIVMIDEGAMTDEAGNDFEGIDDPITWNFTTGDNTAPTVTLIPSEADNQLNSIVIDAVFSEEVVGAIDAITVENASYEVTATDDPLVYEIAIEAEDMDTVTVTVPQTITDVNCNFNPLAEEVVGTYVIGDNTAPTVEVTTAPEDPMNTENTFTVELTFSEVVSGVEAGLEGSVGLDTVVTTDGMVYTLTFSGEDEAEGMLELIGDSVTDVSENMNVLDTMFVWEYMVGDWVDPTATVDPMEGEDLMVDTLNVAVTFSEEVIGLDSGLVVTGGEATVTNDGLVYNVAITAEDGAEVTLELNSNITDDSYNANPLDSASYTYTFGDRTAPVVTVEPETDDNADSTFDVVIIFNEQVTGIEEGIMVMGESATMELSTIVEGMAYKATLSGAEKDTVVLAFTDAIQDIAGNALVPVQYPYIIGDFTAPTLTADPEEGTFVSNEFEVTLTFDEEVTGVEDAVTVSDGEVVVSGSGMVYTAVVTAPSLSDVTLNVGNTVTDLAGNAFAGATYNYSVTGLVAIATVQGEGDESAHVGTTLQVEGTITAVASGEGFFMQDANGAGNGIWVEYTDVASLSIGDGVHVVGTVAEVESVTTILADEVTEAAAPVEVVADTLASPSAAIDEMYESVLVVVKGAWAAEANEDGQWEIYYETSDSVMVNDWIYLYTPTAGNVYHVTGVVNGKADAYMLEPRMESDIVDVTTTTDVNPEIELVEFKVYPNPFNDHIKIDNNDKLTRVVISNIAGQRVIDLEYPSHEIRTARLVSGVYVISMFTEDGLAKTERIIKR